MPEGGSRGGGQGGRSKRRRKNRLPAMFRRPGIPQVTRKALDKTIEDAMANLTLSEAGYASNARKSYSSFKDMSLKKDILRGIHAYGLERPAFVQQTAIVPCLKGRDAIIQAQSGMGKTAALVITVLQRLDRNNPHCQALILVPTRELAEQMEKVVLALSEFMKTPKGKEITVFTCMGGSDLEECKKHVAAGQQIIIGTIGRTQHMLEGDGHGYYLHPNSIKVLAVDEADHLLRGEFGKHMKFILQKIPPLAQVMIMSATMPSYILKQAWTFMKKPLLLLVKDHQLTLAGIKQYYVSLEDESDRLASLVEIYDIMKTARGMIFCNTKDSVRRVMKEMTNAEKEIEHISGHMEQWERDMIMEKFRSGEEGYRVLISSDLLGRGIDIQQINLVVNYELPKWENKEQYIHRVGRAGRYGRKGIAISFVGEGEKEAFEKLKNFYSTQIEPMPENQDLLELLEDTAN